MKKFALGTYVLLILVPVGVALCGIQNAARLVDDAVTPLIDRLIAHGERIGLYINDRSET